MRIKIMKDDLQVVYGKDLCYCHIPKDMTKIGDNVWGNLIEQIFQMFMGNICNIVIDNFNTYQKFVLLGI